MADDIARVIWSLTASGIGTTISGAGNSGGYTATAQNARSAIDLRYVDDMWLAVNAAGGAGTSLKVLLGFYDDLGTLYQFTTGTTPIFGATVASAPGQAFAYAGRHGGGGGSGAYVVPGEWGQVSWSITGSMTGVEICLYGR